MITLRTFLIIIATPSLLFAGDGAIPIAGKKSVKSKLDSMSTSQNAYVDDIFLYSATSECGRPACFVFDIDDNQERIQITRQVEQQYAVVAWNGEEEILWLAERIKSNNVLSGAMLSILPLPGEPISITRGDEVFYNSASNRLSEQLVGAGIKSSISGGTQIGAHSVFVLESNSVADLEKQIQDYVDKKFSGEVDGLIGEYARAVLKDYVNRGFKYFAFDLIRSTNSAEIKVPIQYHFKSNALYYPMVVGKIGGEGKTAIEAVVFTKGGVTGPAPGAKALDFNKVKGSRAASFSNEELKRLDPALGKLFGSAGAAGRMWLIQGDMKSFDGDIYYR